jgi:hypothetical protein
MHRLAMPVPAVAQPASIRQARTLSMVLSSVALEILAGLQAWLDPGADLSHHQFSILGAAIIMHLAPPIGQAAEMFALTARRPKRARVGKMRHAWSALDAPAALLFCLR